MFPVFLTIQIVAIILLLHTLLILMRGDSTHTQKMMIYFLTTSLIQNMGYALEICARSEEAAMVAVKIEYLGCSFLALFYMMFTVHYCSRKQNVLFERILLGMDCVVMLLVWTSELHPFYYKEIRFVEGGYYPHLELQYGPAFLLYMTFSALIPWACAIAFLISSFLREKNEKRRRNQRTVILLTLLCGLVLLTYVLRLCPVPYYDPTPVLIGFLLALMVRSVWNPKDYDLIRVSANTVLNSLNDCVITLNEYREVLSYNDAAVHLFPTITDHKQIDHVERFPMTIFDSEQRSQFVLDDKHYDGHIRTLLDAQQDVRGYAILIVDTTDTFLYVQEVDAMRQKAEKASQAKSDFLANMSHEIRTPMNAIIGLSELIIEESIGRKIYDYACNIKSASMNLLTIINDILDFSKAEAGKMDVIAGNYYLQILIQDTAELVRIVAMQKGLQMKVSLDESLPCQLNGDEGKLRQILINLLNNAVKFTRTGSVSLSVTGELTDENHIRLTLLVEDTGIGIRREDLETIFNAFEQVDMRRNRNSEGSGLGLAITRDLAALMQGDIRVESEYGKGSRFIVTVLQEIVDHRSIAQVPMTRQSLQDSSTHGFKCHDCRVLVVDDNIINRRVALEMISHYGIQVDEADSGQKAIAMAEANRYDIIFMDHMMPEMDGIETTRLILERFPDPEKAPVMIALTANAIQGAREMYLRNGFHDFLAKPFERSDLLSLLNLWIPEEKKLYLEEDEQAPPPEPISEEELIRLFMLGVDVVEAAEKHGSIAHYLELLELFYTDGTRKLDLLRRLATPDELERYAIEAHGLKSAAANIGAKRLSESAKAHEMAGKDSDIDFVRGHLEELLTQYQACLAEVRRVLTKQQYGSFANDSAASGAAPLPAPDPASLREKLEEILHHLEDFQPKDAATELEELLKYDIPENLREELARIQNLLRLYEDDEAEETLAKLLETLS